MTIQEQIDTLLARAEPLRALDDDDPEKGVLGSLVDKINALRAQQAEEAMQEGAAPVEAAAAAAAPPPAAAEPAKRSPGRPKKADK